MELAKNYTNQLENEGIDGYKIITIRCQSEPNSKTRIITDRQFLPKIKGSLKALTSLLSIDLAEISEDPNGNTNLDPRKSILNLYNRSYDKICVNKLTEISNFFKESCGFEIAVKIGSNDGANPLEVLKFTNSAVLQAEKNLSDEEKSVFEILKPIALITQNNSGKITNYLIMRKVDGKITNKIGILPDKFLEVFEIKNNYYNADLQLEYLYKLLLERGVDMGKDFNSHNSMIENEKLIAFDLLPSH